MIRILTAFVIFGLAFMCQALAFSKPKPILIEFEYELKEYTYKCVNCTDREAKNLKHVEKIIRSCINHTKFISHWESFKRIEQSNGLTGAQIAFKIRSTGIKDIPVIFYTPSLFQSKNVVGYTYPNRPEIYLNRNFRRSSDWTNWAEASNLFHETLHKLGFEHDFKATSRRPYSVPYLGNRVIEACERDFI